MGCCGNSPGRCGTAHARSSGHPLIRSLDVDGTLVDSNYHHAIAWYRAFRDHDVAPAVWRIHRHIGMGGDQFVAAVAGDGAEQRCGDEIREAEHYVELLDASELIEAYTSSTDVERTKPEPDLVAAAIDEPRPISR